MCVCAGIWDGFPMEGSSPGDWVSDAGICASELRSLKYNTTVYKGKLMVDAMLMPIVLFVTGHLGIGYHGIPIGVTGLHLGVDHDMRHLREMQSHYRLLPGEWQHGDLGYVGASNFLYGCKKPAHENDPAWDVDGEFWTNLISFYRGRVENVIGQVKSHAWAQGPFRGTFEVMSQYFTISLVLTAMQIKNDFLTTNLSRFEVVGPWQHISE